MSAPEQTAKRRAGYYKTDEGRVDALGAENEDGTFYWAPIDGRVEAPPGERARPLDWHVGERERFDPLEP